MFAPDRVICVPYLAGYSGTPQGINMPTGPERTIAMVGNACLETTGAESTADIHIDTAFESKPTKAPNLKGLPVRQAE